MYGEKNMGETLTCIDIDTQPEHPSIAIFAIMDSMVDLAHNLCQWHPLNMVLLASGTGTRILMGLLSGGIPPVLDLVFSV